ncbi:alkylhydroperoxidase domain protein [Nakamurella lactea]|uniref:alkylhydroperoxidase domain protein n=1 Tax=Nakamurella lactea TaxID=459515 RepID=UPI00040DC5B0|nr:alkylhydroperoxidase domain protein [Nakamurella lactea]
MTTTPDVIDALARISAGQKLDEIRSHRPEARANAQASYLALFDAAPTTGMTIAERWSVAVFVALLHRDAVAAEHYRSAFTAAAPADATALLTAVVDAAAQGAATGPFGHYQASPLQAENTDGVRFSVSATGRAAVGDQLAAALEHAHLLVFRPREAGEDRLRALADAGWSTDAIVTLSQLVSFLTFQLRVVHGLRILGSADRPDTDSAGLAPVTPGAADAGSSTDDEIPDRFTQDELGWSPWLPPLPAGRLTERHWAGLVDRSRANSPYFMLLARDPDILGARTRTDKDIFYNTADGLPRADRELAAAATSRFNGCIFCASVHSRFASHHSRREADVQRLLDDGVTADLGERWNAIVAASVAMARTPVAFGDGQLDALRAAGLDDAEIVDVINGAAFFNWANRLMLSLGHPTRPTG